MALRKEEAAVAADVPEVGTGRAQAGPFEGAKRAIRRSRSSTRPAMHKCAYQDGRRGGEAGSEVKRRA